MKNPPRSELVSVYGMSKAHLPAVASPFPDVVTRCGLYFTQWRGGDSKKVCKHCLRAWRKWRGGAS